MSSVCAGRAQLYEGCLDRQLGCEAVLQGSHMGTLTCRNRILQGLPGGPTSCAVGVARSSQQAPGAWSS